MDDFNSFKMLSFAFCKSLHMSPLLLVEFCSNRPKGLTNIFDISKANVSCIVFLCELYEISQ